MITPNLLVGLVAMLRLAELVLAQHNTQRLKALGAVELGAGHYPWLVALQVSWLVSLVLFIPPDQPAALWPLCLFLMLLMARAWVIASLGPFWTTRIISLPGCPLVRRGPYRFLRHPNYLVVAGEIAVLPLVFGAWPISLAFALPTVAILAWRIRIEEAALAGRRGL
jgi:methyltransferase